VIELNTVRITADTYKKLRDYLLQEASKEAACFILAGFFNNRRGSHFVARELIIPEDKDYDERGDYHIQVSPIFFNRVISKAEREGLTVISCHSHPWANKLSYSPSDDYGERISTKTLFDCLSGKPMGSLLLGKENIIGRVWSNPNSKPTTIDQIRIVGRHLWFWPLSEHVQSATSSQDEVYARQILAFGKKGQHILSTMKIGIVGLGGTGSCIAEQLTRLGISDLILVDNDHLESSNTTRVYGSTARDVTLSKVSIARVNIKRIQPKAKVEDVSLSVISQKVLSILKDCDVVFSCTDRHAPRSVLNELSYQCFIPVIDIGVGLNSDGERITGGSIRATLIGPEMPCLFCYGLVKPETISAELMNPRELLQRQQEGYIEGLKEEAPSVISFTTTAAGLGITLFLDLLFSYMKNQSSNFIFDVTSFDLCRLSVSPRDCSCLMRFGRGDYMPFSAP